MKNFQTKQQIVDAVTHWLEAVVVGLNLCPFAAVPFQAGRVRIQVSAADTEEQLLMELQQQLTDLDTAVASELETTLLVLPELLADFGDYNQFLSVVDMFLEDFGWQGDYQVASFHPRYQFADTAPDDAENLTNRAPYPILHLLRENSLEKAVDGYPDTAQIPERNIRRMNQLSGQQRQQYFPYLFAGNDLDGNT